MKKILLSFIFMIFAHAIAFGQLTMSVQISSPYDDSEEALLTASGKTIGEQDLNSTDLELGQESSTLPQLVGLRFPNILLDENAVITNAYIQFELDANSKSIDPVKLGIFVEDADNAVQFNSNYFCLSQRTLLSDSVAWEIPTGEFNTVNEKYNSPDIKNLINLIINRQGWQSGNAIAFQIRGIGLRECESFDGEAAAAPKLVIEYYIRKTLSIRIKDSDDDSEEALLTEYGKTIGEQDLNSSDLELGQESSTLPQLVAVRFQDVTLDSSAILEEAYIQFELDATSKSIDPVKLGIFVEDSDNPNQYNSNYFCLSQRTLLGDSVAWEIPTGEFNTINEKYNSPDIKSLVDLIINREGWLSGNAIAFQIRGQGLRECESYDGEASAAPLLVVTYLSSSLAEDSTKHAKADSIIAAVEALEETDYTIPTYTKMLMALTTAKNEKDTVSIVALQAAVAELKDKNMPYNVNMHLNGDPTTRMAFAWFTNAGITDGMVKIIAGTVTNINDFSNPDFSVNADITEINNINYNVGDNNLFNLAGIANNSKRSYVAHKALATGLNANTKYSYIVGKDGAWSEIGTFTTAKSNNDEFTFIYIADTQAENQSMFDASAATVHAAKSMYPQTRFTLVTGDLVENPSSEWEYEQWYERMGDVWQHTPLAIVLGNHDKNSEKHLTYHLNSEPTPFDQQLATVPGSVYSFVYGDALFLAMSHEDYSVAGYLDSLKNWMEEQIALHPDTKWRIAYYHKPLYTGASHQDDSDGRTVRNFMAPIFDDLKIDLALQGHDHVYQVIGPVKNKALVEGAITNQQTVEAIYPTNVTGKLGGKYNVDEGTMYFLNSSAGVKKYSPNSEATMNSLAEITQVPDYWSLFTGRFGQTANNDPMYSAVTISSNSIKVKTYSVDKVDGAVNEYDEFTIVKGEVEDPLSTGDISFTAFNTDGNDDVAFVTFKEIPANTTIYFCDSEWNGTGFGTDENDFVWNSGANSIPAGTVISINELDAAITANYGTVTGGTGLSKSGEALFAYHGTGMRQVTTMLAAIANQATAFGTLQNTGLQTGLTAITLTETADIADYIGTRTGLDVNGYQAALNNMSNWAIQDTDNDDQNDGIAPDLPFNLTPFDINMNDVTAPFVTSVSVVDQFTFTVNYSEDITEASAENASNYMFDPAATISSINYNADNFTATITHSGLTIGAATKIHVMNIVDLVGNIMPETYISNDFYFNPSTPNLVITEIMYNAPSDASDNLEFLEIYNAGSTTAYLGGIRVKDEDNFQFTFPDMTLNAGGIVLLATDEAAAEAFYGKNFYDMVPAVTNALGNGGEMLQILNSDGSVIFEMEYDDKSPWPTDADGNGPSMELTNSANDANNGANWVASANLVGQSEGEDVFATPGVYNEVNSSFIAFDDEYLQVDENDGSVNVTLSLTAATDKVVTFNVNVLNGLGTAQNGVDFNYDGGTYTIPANSTTPVTINIPILDNATAGVDRLFALGITYSSNASRGAISEMAVFIVDNEKLFPTASGDLDIEFATSFVVDGNGSAEIVAHDPDSQRLFVLNSTQTKVEILDFSDPANMTKIGSIDMTAHGNGATSIAFMDGIVAATVDGVNFSNGKVVFMDIDGNIINAVYVGNLPDMVTFTPDGKKVLTANEGQPNDEYTVDPEGSISVIDITGGIASLTQADVSTLNFNAFDSQIDALRDAGVRIFGTNATVSRDMEPEYITVSADSKMAWATCQENNALAVIDLEDMMITEILPLGTKNHNLPNNTLDASDKNGFVFMANWNVNGIYMPDAIANYTVNGTTYVVTANEGDQREYDTIDEDISVKDSEIVLDPDAFPYGNLLKKDFMLGRLAVSPYSGDTDGDGDYDELHSFGSRSFSIWNTETGELVYDSGDDFERITANDPTWGSIFNASNSNNNFKNRSDNKGPEPEGITIAKIDGKDYAFIALERIGGVMTYDITNPEMPVFVDYSNNRDLGDDEGGDLGPEGIIYVAADENASGRGLIVVANEVSATISVYYINNDLTPLQVNIEDVQVCYGETAELGAFDRGTDITATGGSGDYSYSWSPSFRLNDATISNPSYGPVYYSFTSFELTVTDNYTGNTVTEGISVQTLPQTQFSLPLFKIVSANDYGTICTDLTSWINGTLEEQNWYIQTSTLTPISDETCYDLSALGVKRLWVEGLGENGCWSDMKRVVVFTKANKQSISENDVVVSNDGSGFMYANPTPVVESLNLFVDFEYATDVEVSILEMSGRKVMSFTKSGITNFEENINLSNLAAGVYFVNVTNGETTMTKKIVKQ